VKITMSNDISEDPDISLSIPLKALYEEYCCPICFNIVDNCFITICGHNFCGSCIKECLNRKHNCPCCNHPTTADQLLKNHHHDRIVSIIAKEKEESSRKYFEKLIKTHQDQPKQTESSLLETIQKLSPIEELFHKHMKKSLMTYEDYYKDLKNKYENGKLALKENYTKKMIETQEIFHQQLRTNPSLSKDQLDYKIAMLTAECEGMMKGLDTSFQNSVDLHLEAYNKYLQEIMPAPSFLPVSVSLSIPSKNIVFKKIVLKTTDSGTDLKVLIEKQMKEKGNPIVSFSPSNIFVIKLLSAKEVPVIDENRPLIQYQVDHGSEIILKGDLQLKSDLPKECFSAMYEKGKEQVMDYYSCRTCKSNWICKPCADACHKGHDICEYILQHKPTWACCYCVKNKTCEIVNIKTKGAKLL